MNFHTVFSSPRPVQLSERTRAFAYEAMHGKYGDEAMQHPCVSFSTEQTQNLTPQEKYNLAVTAIATEAPLRICPHESVSGAATLGKSIEHVVPAAFGEEFLESVSHLTIDFQTVVFRGVAHLEERIRARAQLPLSEEERITLDGMANAARALHIYHRRYLDALKDVKPEQYALLQRVPFSPATCFKEAVQSIWFVFSFVRLCGNWPGIGRLDQMLGGFLERDLERGAITLDEAREFLAGFFIKGCEWIQSAPPRNSGDAQHYQNIVLGGVDRNGREITNEVTYLVLDIVEELGISDFPITVRINENTPQRLLRRVAEVMRHGGGVIAIYNEPLILDALVQFGYPLEEAREFANDGCWEVQIPGKTYFIYRPIDALQILLHDTLRLNTDTPADFDSFEKLYEAFRTNLRGAVTHVIQKRIGSNPFGKVTEHWEWQKRMPCSVISLFEEGCIERARSYLEGGPIYTLFSPHIGGAPDVGNSLYALNRLVFEEQKLSFAELMKLLQNNWEGQELLRQYVFNKYTYYGNDSDEADAYTVRVLNDFAATVKELDIGYPIRFPAGVSTFGRQIDWSRQRSATPFGSRRGDILSGNASPTPNTDFEGATAVIRSYCKANMKELPCGSALDVKLLPSTVAGENGLEALISLMRGFLTLGGFFMQLDVVDEAILKEAQKHPEQYKTLSVRVSGWNARFVTLDRDWQQMIIERSAQSI